MSEQFHTEEFTVRNRAGMHLRPSCSIVNGLRQNGIYNGDVHIILNDVRVEAHDAMAILSLGMQQGTKFTVEMNELNPGQIEDVRAIINKACRPMYEHGHTWNKDR